MSKRFRIAFSFAGEKRAFVAEAAAILAKRFGEAAILYDKFHEPEFAIFDLGIRLQRLYGEQSELIVPVLCPAYDVKPWTAWEWVHIYGLLTKADGHRVMPSRFQRANAEGLSPAAGFIELDDKTPEQFATLILERLALNEGHPKDYYTGEAPLAPDWPVVAPLVEWPVADHSEAQAAFAQLITRATPLRLLPIHGDNETGKSHLTKQFLRNALRNPDLTCGRFDFKGTSDMDAELRAFAQRLGVPLPTPGTGVSSQLAQVFAAVMKFARPTLLIFDTFEQAGEADLWVKNNLLLAIIPPTWLRVIIVGRRVTMPRGEPWAGASFDPIELRPPSPEEWFAYGESHSRSPAFTIENVRLVHEAVKGKGSYLAELCWPQALDFSEQLRILQAAHGSPALLPLAIVDLVHHILPAADRTRIKDALVAAAVPHWCDRSFLAALLDTRLEEGDRLLGQLRALTVVEPFPARGEHTVNVLEAARLAVREHLRAADAARWKVLSVRAYAHVINGLEPHARIEALYHLFATDQPAAAAVCESLDQELTDSGRPEVRHALALALRELTGGGWLKESALVEALLSPLKLRLWRGETTQIETDARDVVGLARNAFHPSGISRGLGLLGSTLQEEGRIDAALEAFREVVAISERHASTDPFNDRWQRDLAFAHSSIGGIALAQDRLDDAEAAFHKALVAFERRASSDPYNVNWQRDLAFAHSRVGDIAQAQGRLDDARAAFQKARIDSERRASTDSSNVNWQRDLAFAHSRVGDIALAQGRLDDARAAHRQGLAISERLASTDPSNVRWQRDLALAYSSVGAVALAQDRLDDAAAGFRERLAIFRRLASTDPFDARSQRDLARAHCRVGDIALAQGRLDDASAAFHKALGIFKCLASTDSSNADWQRDLAAAHSSAGEIAQAQGRLDDAWTAFREALGISKRLASTDPFNADWQRQLAVAQRNVGDIALMQQRLDDAWTAFFEAVAISERLASTDPSNTRWQRDLAVAHGRVGDIALAQGRLDDALTAFRQDLAISQHLTSIDPSAAGWQRDLAVTHNRVGAVLHAQGRLGEALAAFREYLAISERLASTDPSNADWQRELAVAHSWLGQALQGMGNRARAQSSYNAAIEALERAVAESPGTAGWKQELASLKSWSNSSGRSLNDLPPDFRITGS